MKEYDEHDDFEFDNDDYQFMNLDNDGGLFVDEIDTTHDTANYDDIDTQSERKQRIQKTQPAKLIGKHSLARDTIFKGKRVQAKTEDEMMYESEHIIKESAGSLELKEDSLEYEESRTGIETYRDSRLKIEIKKILSTYTDINFEAPRRKPSKSDFNAYYKLLLKDLYDFGYSKCEIFIELSGYFTDNIWTIFLLLENKYSNIIIQELREKYDLSEVDQIDIF